MAKALSSPVLIRLRQAVLPDAQADAAVRGLLVDEIERLRAVLVEIALGDGPTLPVDRAQRKAGVGLGWRFLATPYNPKPFQQYHRIGEIIETSEGRARLQGVTVEGLWLEPLTDEPTEAV